MHDAQVTVIDVPGRGMYAFIYNTLNLDEAILEPERSTIHHIKSSYSDIVGKTFDTTIWNNLEHVHMTYFTCGVAACRR